MGKILFYIALAIISMTLIVSPSAAATCGKCINNQEKCSETRYWYQKCSGGSGTPPTPDPCKLTFEN